MRIPTRTAGLSTCRLVTCRQPRTGANAQRPTRGAVRSRAAKDGAISDKELQSMAEQIMKSDPDAASKLKRIQEAADRVARAQAAMKEFEKLSAQTLAEAAATQQQKIQEAEDYMAEVEVQAAQKRMQAAELEVESANAAQGQLAAAARKASLKDAERMQSVKAGAAAVVGGITCSVPLILASPLVNTDALLAVGADVVSALLFGVTYRYIIRQQRFDGHLKSGAVAAFAIVRGVGGSELLAVTGADGDIAIAALNAAAYLGESFLVFAFAAAALEVAIQQGFVKAYVDQ